MDACLPRASLIVYIVAGEQSALSFTPLSPPWWCTLVNRTLSSPSCYLGRKPLLVCASLNIRTSFFWNAGIHFFFCLLGCCCKDLIVVAVLRIFPERRAAPCVFSRTDCPSHSFRLFDCYVFASLRRGGSFFLLACTGWLSSRPGSVCVFVRLRRQCCKRAATKLNMSYQRVEASSVWTDLREFWMKTFYKISWTRWRPSFFFLAANEGLRNHMGCGDCLWFHEPSRRKQHWRSMGLQSRCALEDSLSRRF